MDIADATRSSLLPDAFQPAQCIYMPFPFDMLRKIPQNPADDLRLAWANGTKHPFLDWLQTGLASVHYDVSEMKFHALVHYKASGILVAHDKPASNFGQRSAMHKTVGKLHLEAVYQPGRVPDAEAIRLADQIVVETRNAADNLLQVLSECTVALYGTETPCKAWPALLRAAARGWAVAMIKAKLGSHLKKFDLNGNTDDNDPDYLFRFFFITEEFRMVDQASCPARITNLLVRMFVDAKVPLFENEEENVMRLNQIGMAHLGLPDSRDEKWLDQRRQYWRTETDLLVKNLFPLDYCIRIMFGPVLHFTEATSAEPSGHTCDFLVDDPEDKIRKAAEDAERRAKLPPPTKAQRAYWKARRRCIVHWERENGRCWGTPLD
ncbi:hypothetical protein GE09DRAFT_1188315 [Coniochaeta sp. 2T2.1]|nr:hypothetical protein GE09DRAFT_1188315 [Coniochaeta sp. 2T2.1]